MRHRRQTRKLGRLSTSRDVLLRDLARGLLLNQRISTTLIKAKELKRFADRLITLGKEDGILAKRRAYQLLNNRKAVSLLFKEVAPRFKNRLGGYTRIMLTKPRGGDGTLMAIVELTELKIEEPKVKAKKEKVKPAKAPKTKEPGEAKEAAKEAPPAKKEELPKKEKHIAVEAPPVVHPPAKEKPKKKGFFKDLRQYFMRKADHRTGG